MCGGSYFKAERNGLRNVVIDRVYQLLEHCISGLGFLDTSELCDEVVFKCVYSAGGSRRYNSRFSPREANS